MPTNPELYVPHSPFDPGSLRRLHVVDLEKLKRASDEEPFVREGFELLKEASMFLVGKVEPIAMSVLAGGYTLPAR